jgi:hypothetical protein
MVKSIMMAEVLENPVYLKTIEELDLSVRLRNALWVGFKNWTDRALFSSSKNPTVFVADLLQIKITPSGRDCKIYAPKPKYFTWHKLNWVGQKSIAEICEVLQNLSPDLEPNTVIVDRPDNDVEFFTLLIIEAMKVMNTLSASAIDSDLQREILGLYRMAGCEVTNGDVLDLGNAPDPVRAKLAAILSAAALVQK